MSWNVYDKPKCDNCGRKLRSRRKLCYICVRLLKPQKEGRKGMKVKKIDIWYIDPTDSLMDVETEDGGLLGAVIRTPVLTKTSSDELAVYYGDKSENS